MDEQAESPDLTPTIPGGAAGRAVVRLFLYLGLAAVVLWTFLLGLLPPLEKDALIHHLVLPHLWLKAGGFVRMPWAPFSYYPMNVDSLYLLPLALG
ncbi:MAG: hypothetical protein AB1896_22655, partial [Thermodesulfobacteriota bacterium]